MKEIDKSILRELRKQYLSTKENKLQRLLTLTEYLTDNFNFDTLTLIKDELHKIAGSAGSYGFPELSRICKDAETKVENLLEKRKIADNPLPDWTIFLKEFDQAFQENQEPPRIIHTLDILKGKKVLLIDDDDELSLNICEVMKVMQLDCKHLRNPLLIAEYIRSYNPDLILLDVEMPEISGVKIVEMLKENDNFSHIPIVILTSARDQQVLVSLFMKDIEGIIRKSDNYELLSVQICLYFKKSLRIEKCSPIHNIPVELSQPHETQPVDAFKTDQTLHSDDYIIFTDDDKDLTKILSYAFDARRMAYKIFNSGHECLDYLNMLNDSNLPSLIILDRELEDMDGLEILAKTPSFIKERIPVIFLSSKSTETDTLAGLKSGAWDYIYKPFSINVLFEKVKKYITLKK